MGTCFSVRGCSIFQRFSSRASSVLRRLLAAGQGPSSVGGRRRQQTKMRECGLRSMSCCSVFFTLLTSLCREAIAPQNAAHIETETDGQMDFFFFNVRRGPKQERASKHREQGEGTPGD